MNNVLLSIGGALVAVLCALFAVPHFVDWTSYRGVFEEEASRVLGRDVRVAGAVNLRLLPTPYVRFEKVRLADAAGQTGEPFFRADEFTLWLSPGPLLWGAIEAREIELRRPILKLRLDAAGGGNWQTLSIARAALPFVPSDVALQSVRISDGVVSVDDAGGQELVRVGGVSGELNAATLEGPYKFRGVFDVSGANYELRASTTAFESDGGLRMKAQLTVPSIAQSYGFDGRVADLSGRAKLEGQITGQLAFLPTTNVPASPDRARTNRPFDLRATVTADTSGAKVTDLNLAFEQEGKPQLIAGATQISWQRGIDVRTELNTRWIDLDQVLASPAGAKPLEIAHRLATNLGSLVPATGVGRTEIKADQVTLGGEALGGLNLLVESSNGAVKLSNLRIGLPGGTRAQLSGTLPSANAFDGEISLRGANLTRFMTWLGRGAALVEGRTEDVFSLKSKLALGPQSIQIKEAFASLGNAVITGSIGYRWTERSRLDVVIEGDEIDLGLVFPKALDLQARVRELTGGQSPVLARKPAVAATSPLPANAIDPTRQDASLRIRAGRLRDAEHDLRDVDLDATLINGTVAVRRLRFASGSGLELEAEGEVGDVATRPRGTLRGTVAAASAGAVTELVELFQQNGDPSFAQRLSVAAPVRTAWTLRFGDGRDTGKETGKDANAKDLGAASRVPAEVWLDGAILGRRMNASIRLDGGLRNWRQHNLQVNVAIERPDWQRLRSAIALEQPAAGIRPSTGPSAANSTRARLLLKVAGRPDQALRSYLKLEDDAFDASMSGRLVLGNDTISAIESDLQLRAPDVVLALTAIGLPVGNLPAFAVDGGVEVSLKDGAFKVTPTALEVAGALLGGEVLVSTVKDRERRRIEGRLTASEASIPRLLDLLADKRIATPRDGEPHVWPASAFDFSGLDRLEGRVRLETGQLNLTSELKLGRGLVVAEFGPGKVDIVSLDGDVLGSRLYSRWLIEKVAAGANVIGTAKVENARLDLLSKVGGNINPGRIGGTASVVASVSGRGLSPRSLVTSLIGKGEIDIVKGELGAVSPLILRRVSDDVIGGRRPATEEAAEQGVVDLMANVATELRVALGGNRKLPFEVAEGIVRMGAFTLTTPEGRASNRTTVDLTSLKIDSEWRIEERLDKAVQLPPTPGLRPQGALPPITIVFVGPAANLGRLDPVISVDSLVRELSVRRMERDVEELERLRRVDEERAKSEADRLQAEAEARAAAAKAAAAASAGPQPSPSALTPGGEARPLIPVGEARPLTIAPVITVPTQPALVAPGVVAADPQTPPATVPPVDPAAAVQAPETKRRQIPSSQQLNKSGIQDVFKNQGGG